MKQSQVDDERRADRRFWVMTVGFEEIGALTVIDRKY